MHGVQRDAAYCYRCSVVYVSVCLSDTTRSCAKTAGRIDMPFAVWTRVGPKNHVLRWGPNHPQ